MVLSHNCELTGPLVSSSGAANVGVLRPVPFPTLYTTIQTPHTPTLTSRHPSWYDHRCCQDGKPQQLTNLPSTQQPCMEITGRHTWRRYQVNGHTRMAEIPETERERGEFWLIWFGCKGACSTNRSKTLAVSWFMPELHCPEVDCRWTTKIWHFEVLI